MLKFKQESGEKMDVLYLCDRKACENCSSKCRHTKDICHAINFEKCEGGGYWEKDTKPLLVLKTDCLLKREVVARIRNDIKKQIEEGLVLVDGSITEIKWKQDADGPLIVCQGEVKNE